MRRPYALYRRMFRRFGPQNWWPARTPMEMMVGAILTQNTAWVNVERAIANLRRAGIISARRLAGVSRARLEQAVRPSGYFRQKAVRLQGFARYLRDGWRYDWRGMLVHRPLALARAELLSLHGVGPETADSILLYAAGRPVFVIDAYTRRICRRVGIGPRGDAYETWRAFFESRLPKSAGLYNEFHALFVRLAKEFCRAVPLCGPCPLRPICRTGKGGSA